MVTNSEEKIIEEAIKALILKKLVLIVKLPVEDIESNAFSKWKPKTFPPKIPNTKPIIVKNKNSY